MIVRTTAKQKDLLRNLSAMAEQAQRQFSVACSAIIAGQADVADGASVELLPDGNLSVAEKEN